MAESEAMLGYGSTFEIATSGISPTEYVSLGEILSITSPSANVDMIDVTHMQSPNRTREFISGLIDPGECSFEMNYIPDSAGDLELREILAITTGATRRRQCRIRYPNGVTTTFSGELQTYEKTIPLDDKMTATVNFKVTGIETYGVVT
jgi:hypothetical protein